MLCASAQAMIMLVETKNIAKVWGQIFKFAFYTWKFTE